MLNATPSAPLADPIHEAPRIERRARARRRLDVLGAPVDLLGLEELMAAVDSAVQARRRLELLSVNVHWITLQRRDEELAQIADRFSLRICDGAPVRWVAGAGGADLPRLAGADLVPEFCAESARRGWKVFLFGAEPGVADRARAAAEARWPGCQIVGTASPDLEEIDDLRASRRWCDRINASGADVLLVALGMPRQELWLDRHAADLDVPVRFGCGASIDFLAGDVSRAPVALQRAGFEWAWRLAVEPRRLWRRYLVEDREVAFEAVSVLVRTRLRPRAKTRPGRGPKRREVWSAARTAGDSAAHQPDSLNVGGMT